MLISGNFGHQKGVKQYSKIKRNKSVMKAIHRSTNLLQGNNLETRKSGVRLVKGANSPEEDLQAPGLFDQ